MYCLYCKNCFCIYYQYHLCRLDHICLDIHGRCASCMYIDRTGGTLLQEKREKLLKRYQDEEAAWQSPAIKKASE